MRTLILSIVGLLVGYIVGNLEYKAFEEIIEDLIFKLKTFKDVTLSFIITTLSEIEGYDSDEVKANIDELLQVLKLKAEKISNLPTFEEKLYFIEDEVAKFSKKITKEYPSNSKKK